MNSGLVTLEAALETLETSQVPQQEIDKLKRLIARKKQAFRTSMAATRRQKIQKFQEELQSTSDEKKKARYREVIALLQSLDEEPKPMHIT